MNLAKNGAVLLAALSVFAMTSCGSKEKKIDLDAAKTFLKDATKSTLEGVKVKHEAFSWNISVTGTGMKHSDDKTGGAEFMLDYLIVENEKLPMAKIPTRLAELAKIEALQKLSGNWNDEYRKDKLATEQELTIIEADYLDEMEKWEEITSDISYYSDGSTLRMTFEREQEIPNTDITAKMKQQIVVKKDGQVKYWSVSVDKQALKLTDFMGITCDGTLTGTIKSHFVYQDKK